MLVDIQNLSKAYVSSSLEKKVEVLRGLNFALQEGATAAILGPSGSGKSTLLNILGALDHGDSGQVRVAGVEPSALRGRELSEYRRRTVGLVFQSHHLLPQCTVLENVILPSLADSRAVRSEVAARGRELLDALGLAHRLDHRPGELSGGECQRVAVARAMAGNPGLLLADEPTGALDRASAAQLTRALLDLNRTRKVALLVVTHSQELAAQMQEVWEIKDGVLVRVP